MTQLRDAANVSASAIVSAIRYHGETFERDTRGAVRLRR
jgi:hypothetical protein